MAGSLWSLQFYGQLYRCHNKPLDTAHPNTSKSPHSYYNNRFIWCRWKHGVICPVTLLRGTKHALYVSADKGNQHWQRALVPRCLVDEVALRHAFLLSSQYFIFSRIFPLLHHTHYFMHRQRYRFISPIEVKDKVKFTLEQATKAQRGSRGIAPLFL